MADKLFALEQLLKVVHGGKIFLNVNACFFFPPAIIVLNKEIKMEDENVAFFFFFVFDNN